MAITYKRVSEDTYTAHFLGHRLGQVWRTISGWQHAKDRGRRFGTKEEAGSDLYGWVKSRIPA